jgi:hypothetical protein
MLYVATNWQQGYGMKIEEIREITDDNVLTISGCSAAQGDATDTSPC